MSRMSGWGCLRFSRACRLFLRWLVYYVLLICIYVSLYYNTTIQEFFYFQF